MHRGISTATMLMLCATTSRDAYIDCLSFPRTRATSEILAWERRIRLFVQLCEESKVFLFVPALQYVYSNSLSLGSLRFFLFLLLWVKWKFLVLYKAPCIFSV